MSFPQVFVVFAVFAVFGDKWLVGVGPVVFDVDDSGGDHFYQGEAFAYAGDPAVGFFVAGVCHEEVVAAWAGFQGEVDFLGPDGGVEDLAGDVGGEVGFYKLAEGVEIVDHAGGLIFDLVAAFDAGFQELEDFDGPIDEGDAAVGHAFLKLIDQLF
mgnify:FL=1